MATTAEIKSANRDTLDQIALENDIDPTQYNTVADLRAVLLPLATDVNDQQQPEPEQPDFPAGTRFWRTHIPGLQVIIGSPDTAAGEVAPQMASFVPYWELLPGVEGKQKIAYLATDNAVANRKLESDYNVVEIDEDKFLLATTEEFNSDGVQVAGLRAPY